MSPLPEGITTRQAMLRDRLNELLRLLMAEGYALGEIAWALRLAARDWGKSAGGDL